MDNNNFFLDYAITVSVLSDSILDKKMQLKTKKKYYHQLTIEQQNEYLEMILKDAIRISKNYEGNDFKQFFTCEFETHHNIVLKNGKPKQHLHGVFYQCTKEDIVTIESTIHYIIRVYNDKQKSKCVKIVPVYYDKGWSNYMKKDQTQREMELDLLELETTIQNPLDN